MAAIILFLSLLLLLPFLSESSCIDTSSQYSSCIDLPHLSATLHFTHDAANSTLSLAFVAPSTGWVAWGLGDRMVGAQCLIAFLNGKNSVAAATANITRYGPVRPSPIRYETWEVVAESADGFLAVFATVKLPPGTREVSHVWQVGPMMPGWTIGSHPLGQDNVMAIGTIDLAKTGILVPQVSAKSGANLGKVHGVLNGLSWGILLPTGAMIARFLKAFKPESVAWFYLHISWQSVGYLVSVVGWATGVRLGSLSNGIGDTGHGNIGNALFALSTLQMFALVIRPKKDHKYRGFWNVYHHAVGYIVIVMGVINVCKGLRMLDPGPKWINGYKFTILLVALVAVVLEIISWIRMAKSEEEEAARRLEGGSGNSHQQQVGYHPFSAGPQT